MILLGFCEHFTLMAKSLQSKLLIANIIEMIVLLGINVSLKYIQFQNVQNGFELSQHVIN